MATTLPTALNPIVLSDLTDATLNGDGIFDVLMQANKAHLDEQFAKDRIKGPEFATVYLGSLQTVMGAALQFLLQKQAANQDALLKAKQLDLMDAQLLTAQAQLLQVQAQTALVEQQALNAVTEDLVLTAQKCKLQAEFDVLILTKDKTTSETNLMLQKIVTEKAQVTALGVDADSVVGRQKALYVAQTDGFKRDAEQKAAKLMVDTWNVRRTTDEATQATDTVTTLNGVTYQPNFLGDASVGRAVTKLLTGVGA